MSPFQTVRTLEGLSPLPWRREAIPTPKTPKEQLPQPAASMVIVNYQPDDCHLDVPAPRFVQAPLLNITEAEPRVLLSVAGKNVTFLLDTGATFSALIHHPGPALPSSLVLTGIQGNPTTYRWTLPTR